MTKKSESYSIVKPKKLKGVSVCASNQYNITNDSKKKRISYEKTSSAKSKSSNLQKYQGLFYVILVVFILNLVLNCIGDWA